MKKVSFLLVCIMCLSLIGCSLGGIDINNDGNDDLSLNLSSPIVYTVSFNTNGGTRVPSKKVVELARAPMTSQAGCEFKGWYRDPNFEIPVIYPLKVDSNMTLYARWLKVEGTARCENASIKFMDDSYSSSLMYTISPSGFDLQALASEGYTIEIEVEYDVYYRKDYDILWDIGYAGSPKYEVYIYNSDRIGVAKENLSTKTSSQTRKITYTASAHAYQNTAIYLKFSTDNIQNVIYFKNIQVNYKCYK